MAGCFRSMPPINDALRGAAARLRAAGVPQAMRDARLLLSAVTGRGLEAMISDPHAGLAPEHAQAYAAMIARRVAREPVSRILGRREFWSLEFEITPDTLDPRPDSETLIVAALDLSADRCRPLRILDLGTGSGCLLLALLAELPNAAGVGADISQAALKVARNNAARLGLAARAKFIHCDLRTKDWPRIIGGRFDLLIANPPYIADAEFAGLMPEVSLFDPRAALAGGEDGLDFYRLITISMKQLLARQSHVVFEAGQGQAARIGALLRAAGLTVLSPACDLTGIERAVTGQFGA